MPIKNVIHKHRTSILSAQHYRGQDYVQRTRDLEAAGLALRQQCAQPKQRGPLQVLLMMLETEKARHRLAYL
jgi:hypothetical protein